MDGPGRISAHLQFMIMNFHWDNAVSHEDVTVAGQRVILPHEQNAVSVDKGIKDVRKEVMILVGLKNLNGLRKKMKIARGSG